MSEDGEEFYKKRASWLQDMWDAEREELNACRKRSNEYFLEYCKERDALRAENEKLNGQAAMNGRLLTENAELREENRLVGLQMDRMADEIERLRAALKPFADMAAKQAPLCLEPDIDHWLIGECDLTLGDLRAAAAAFKGDGG